MISVVQSIVLRRARARDQMNLVLTNLKTCTKQCAICVKLRDGVVSLTTHQGIVAAGKSVGIIRNQQIITQSFV